MTRELFEAVRYGSLSEVVRAGLRALERDTVLRPRLRRAIGSGVTEEAPGAILKARVEEALADPAPSIPQADVFAALRSRHAKRGGAKSDKA